MYEHRIDDSSHIPPSNKMSTALQRVSNMLTLSLGHVTLNPIVTSIILYLLTKSPDRIRGRVLQRLKLLDKPDRFVKVVKGLKWCLALGIVGKVNKQLNHVSLNAGRWGSERRRWKFDGGEGEVAVVTGGCSGIGELIVKRLVGRGVRVAILDIQKLPASLQGCK